MEYKNLARSLNVEQGVRSNEKPKQIAVHRKKSSIFKRALKNLDLARGAPASQLARKQEDFTLPIIKKNNFQNITLATYHQEESTSSEGDEKDFNPIQAVVVKRTEKKPTEILHKSACEKYMKKTEEASK